MRINAEVRMRVPPIRETTTALRLMIPLHGPTSADR